jgi:hypothetical protein
VLVAQNYSPSCYRHHYTKDICLKSKRCWECSVIYRNEVNLNFRTDIKIKLSTILKDINVENDFVDGRINFTFKNINL